MVKNSNDIQAVVNGNAIGFTTSVSLSISNSLVEVTTKPTGSWKETATGHKSATISFDGLATSDLSNINPLENSIRNGSLVTFRFGVVGTQEYDGDGYISNLEISGGTDDAPTFSGSIEVSDELTEQINTEVETLQILGDNVTINGDTLMVAVQV